MFLLSLISNAGLTMELFIRVNSYLPILQQSSGIRVMVGSQNQMPFPEDEGVTVSPGQETSIAVRKVRSSKNHELSEINFCILPKKLLGPLPLVCLNDGM